jgi:hypothetical protein
VCCSLAISGSHSSLAALVSVTVAGSLILVDKAYPSHFPQKDNIFKRLKVDLCSHLIMIFLSSDQYILGPDSDSRCRIWHQWASGGSAFWGTYGPRLALESGLADR